jgi:hypothetical protein
MALSKIEGITFNVKGNGLMYPYMIGGREMITGVQDENGNPIKSLILPLRPVDLNLEQDEGISRFCKSKVNERWRFRVTNGKVPGAFFMLKWAAMYTIPLYSAREESELGG